MNFNDNFSLFAIDNDKYLAKINTINDINKNVDNGLTFNNITLPEMFENILYKNNVLGHSYYSTNSWDYQKYESYHQFYYKKFDCNFKNPIIIFEGIDTLAEIYVNGEKIGFVENMFIPHKFMLNNLKAKDNEIVVHILPCVLEGRKYPKEPQAERYLQEGLNIRKSAYSFGWDIFVRAPLGGFWKGIQLKEYEIEIEETYIISTILHDKTTLKFNVKTNESLNNANITIKGSCKDSNFNTSCLFNGNAIELEAEIKNPYLWNIRGYGEPNLYSIDITIEYNGKTITKHVNYGIRSVDLKYSYTVCENGCFNFIINEQKVFILGTNWVPTEAIYHYDVNKMRQAINMAIDLNCNAIRVWGGGIYEIDEFYDLCDKNGILVWQDFMMGCASYPQSEEFQNKIKVEGEYQIKRLRNHPSVCLFSGDNECDCAWLNWCKLKLNPNTNVLTRKILPNLVKELACKTPFLPSSPYISQEFIDAQKQGEQYMPEDHLWGARDYFRSEYYTKIYAYFASEMGYHGCPSPKSLNKFMKNTYPLFDENGNPTLEYLCHATSVKNEYDSPYAYRIKLMSEQVDILFNTTFDNIDDFAKASQISQAEALKYFIENFRINRNTKGGIIWWNILDGWPQISDAVVDYYLEKKLAYYFIKTSQQPAVFCMKENEDKLQLYFINDYNKNVNVEYTIIDGYENIVVDKGEFSSNKYLSSLVKEYVNDVKNQKLYIIKYVIDGKKYVNHYHTNIKGCDYKKYVNAMDRYNLLTFNGFDK